MQKFDQKNQKKMAKKPEKIDTTVFGKRLDAFMEQQRSLKPQFKVPEFIQDIVGYLLLKGLGEEGIFRQTADKNLVEPLKQELDKGGKLDFTKVTDVHLLANLIKIYLNSLPVSVISPDLYESFVELVKNSANTEEELNGTFCVYHAKLTLL
jgi:hypothetical protein